MSAVDNAFRCEIVHFTGDPDQASHVHHFRDGVLLVHEGRVVECGPAEALLAQLDRATPITDLGDRLLLPGFVDTHVHFPQLEVIASYGGQLLDWLERYTFPAEARYADTAFAEQRAGFFVQQLLLHGTTTALAFATIHPGAVDALFGAAEARGMCLATGRVMMDRNAPDALRDDTEASFHESVALIEKWHGRGRLRYAVTPRFAATSTERQLALCRELLDRHPGVLLQSHVAENLAEVRWVRELYPDSRSYLDVYDRFGLLRPGAVYAHCIHLDDIDRERMASSGTSMSFCPSSNLFLGSGLFDFATARAGAVQVSLGTDVGAGTSLSMLRTLADAYKVGQLRGEALTPLRAFHLATFGGARALALDDRIGSFAPGRDADFVVLDWAGSGLAEHRQAHAATLEERLFALMILGDERNVHATYVAGRRQH